MFMPPAAATTAEGHDLLLSFLTYVSLFFFALIVGAIILFVIRYRRRSAGQKTSPIEGNRRLEVVWAAIPAILLIVTFLWGFREWMDLNVPPANALEVRVFAKKWSWEFDYPKQGLVGAPDLVVPEGRPVKLTMSSADVIHSFFVPAFRLKRDVLPNRYTVLWFEATQPGSYDLLCAEYCGTGHSVMHALVKVVSQAEFQRWVDSGGGLDQVPPQDLGKHLFEARGCAACHSISRDRKGLAGPPLAGIFGHQTDLADGSRVQVDDNYLRESIMEPAAKVVSGYAPVMPTFKGRLSDRQVNALIDFIKSLK
jgi:cytochrome c oxidase subunit 2